MKRIYQRTIAALLLVALLLAGFGLYLFRYFTRGDEWVTFGVNAHAYSGGVLKMGAIYDVNGAMLSGVSDGERVFSDDPSVRRATLHVVGDASGNIGTGLLTSHATDLIGYDILNGAYSRTGEGNNIYTTLDAEVCAAALSALGGNKGAVVVYNYLTGAIVCMVSAPGFDPADPPQIEEDDDAFDGAYINRALSSTFTPGSIFKIVTLAAAIERIDDLDERVFHCDGSCVIGGETINCNGVHGDVGIRDALAYSCNVAFAQLAEELGGKTLEKYAGQMGLLDSFEIDGIRVAGGSFDVAPDGSGNLAWSGIGQHMDLVNPTAFMRLMGAVANHGRAANPRLIQRVTTPSGIPVGIRPVSGNVRLLSQTTADAIAEMMAYNVETYYGGWRFPGLQICAKSGTAEIDGGETPHAWFAGFLADEQNPYAFVVFVENGGWGVSVAGSVANTVLQAAVDRE